MNMGAWEFVRPRILTVRKVRVFFLFSVFICPHPISQLQSFTCAFVCARASARAHKRERVQLH